MPDQAKTDRTYWAFISYSAKDKASAAWLHRVIESYNVPSGLVGRPVPAGGLAPRRFRPVFRDRADLAAASELTASIVAALRDSAYLIVVCSPHAARSRWVNTEIETFQRHGRSGSVLAIIVDGEPGGGEHECFPPALRSAEPIAADARPEGDGRTDAALKLLAGMLGVGFDVLKQRDTRRRIRRLRIGIGSALILVMMLAGLAFFANWQRVAAEQARTRAKSILEFLVYDLGRELEPIGRLDIVRQVQDQVDAYYRDLGVEAGVARSEHNRAAAHDRSGERLSAEGRLPDALREYRAALEIRERLVVQSPEDSALGRNLLVSHVRIGELLLRQGDPSGSLEAFQTALAIAEQLTAADPANATWQRDLSASHIQIGDLMAQRGDLAAAAASYETADAIRDRLASSDPNDPNRQRDLSETRERIGDVRLAQGQPQAALAAYEASFTIRERLAAANPSNRVWQRYLAWSHQKIGDARRALGELPLALRSYSDSLVMRERIVAADVSNALHQHELSISQTRVGDVRAAQGELARALDAFQHAFGVLQRLREADPSNTAWQRDGGLLDARIADVLERQGDPSALEWWRKALAALAPLEARSVLSKDDVKFLEYLRRKAG